MYSWHAPQVVSRRIVNAPVNAPKNSVLVSTAIGAVTSMVGVPTSPSSDKTAPDPRCMPVVDTGGLPPIDALVDGQIGGVVRLSIATSASTLASASGGS